MSIFKIFKNKDSETESTKNTETNRPKRKKIPEEALDYCEEKLQSMLNLSGLDADVSAHIKDEYCIYIDIESETDSGRIIGRNGNMIESLQVLLKAMIYKKFDTPIQLLIDVGGYVERRIESAKETAIIKSRQLSDKRPSIALEPMPASERRAIHIEFKENKRISSHSEGEGSNRHIVLEYTSE